MIKTPIEANLKGDKPMRKTNRTTTTYIEGDWIIDIIETPTYFDAYLQKSDNAVKYQIFGMDKKNTKPVDYNYFKTLIEAGLPEYIEAYIEEFDY